MKSNYPLTSARCNGPIRPRLWRATRCPGRAFTLVELLVVITIIGILASLITVAATAALDAARRAVIKTELDQIAMAFQHYKNVHGSYPPSFAVETGYPDRIKSQLRRHMRKAFPRSKDTATLEELLDLINLDSPDPPLNAAEVVVFWLGGFSADPEYPLTGPGGPLARPKNPDPKYPHSNLDDRRFLFEFDKSRLTRYPNPDNPDIDKSGPNARSIEITTTEYPDYWVDLPEYYPRKRTEPYLYFDTSRFVYGNPNNVPNRVSYVPYYQKNDGAYREILPYISTEYDFVDPESFQVLSAGTDDEWGEYLGNNPLFYNKDNYGPFVGGHADNLVNFSQKTLEDSQP